MLRKVRVTRYVTPLREGGSLPAIVEAEDEGLYVLKFRGAGQGPLALVAELISGEIGRLLGLRVPELVFMDLDTAIGRNEPDPEIRDLLLASVGLNLGMDFLLARRCSIPLPATVPIQKRLPKPYGLTPSSQTLTVRQRMPIYSGGTSGCIS
jgi:hypothetical protein